MSTNNYGEPWKFNLDMDAVPITRADGTAVLGNCEINEPDLVRAVTCVNACADIPDPAAAIQAARESLEAVNVASWAKYNYFSLDILSDQKLGAKMEMERSESAANQLCKEALNLLFTKP